MKIELGDRVRDRLTGFKGIVIGVTEWLYGCRRITVQPEELDKEGAISKAESFDEDQVEVVRKAAFQVRVPVEGEQAEMMPEPVPGGPRDTPSRRADPTR